MGFATPWIVGAACAAALAITALHLLSMRQPRDMRWPTARFVPERAVRAVARQTKPNDVVLLLLRVIALLAAGAALAGARCGPTGVSTASIVVIDASQRADSVALTASARAALASAGATSTDDAAVAVLWVRGVMHDPGAALTATIREAARLAQANPSLDALSLSVVMPPMVRSRAGWDAWRGEWPARIQIIPSAPADTSVALSRVRVMSDRGGARAPGAADVVDAAFALRGATAPPGTAVDGTDAEAADVIVLRSDDESDRDARPGVSVRWPVNGMPVGWRRAPADDSVGAVTAGGLVVVAPWVRTALPPPLSDSVVAIAWWSDGVAVAVERTRGSSCVREVALAVPDGSDLLLSSSADGLLRAVRAPCGGRAVPSPREGTPSNLTATVPADRFRAPGLAPTATQPTWLATALLVLALSALVTEQIVRRRATPIAAGDASP